MALRAACSCYKVEIGNFIHPTYHCDQLEYTVNVISVILMYVCTYMCFYIYSIPSQLKGYGGHRRQYYTTHIHTHTHTHTHTHSSTPRISTSNWASCSRSRLASSTSTSLAAVCMFRLCETRHVNTGTDLTHHCINSTCAQIHVYTQTFSISRFLSICRAASISSRFSFATLSSSQSLANISSSEELNIRIM